jgi:RNA polymerase sigma-B factor
VSDATGGTKPTRLSAAQAEARFRELQATGDEDIRKELIEAHIGLADYFARRYRNRGVSADDLRQIAYVGLVKAVDRFDPERNVKFATFAGRTMDGELKRWFRDRTWAVRVPRHAQELHLQVRKAAETLNQELGRSPKPAELAERTGLDVAEVLEALDAAQAYRAKSIDRPSPGEDDGPSFQLSDGEQGYGRVEARVVVQELLEDLPERERKILELRFYGQLSQSQIAEQVGISQMHVSRLLRRTIDQLRERLEA